MKKTQVFILFTAALIISCNQEDLTPASTNSEQNAGGQQRDTRSVGPKCPEGQKSKRLLYASYSGISNSDYHTSTTSCEQYSLASLDLDIENETKSCDGDAVVWGELDYWINNGDNICRQKVQDGVTKYFGEIHKLGSCCVEVSENTTPDLEEEPPELNDNQACVKQYGEDYESIFNYTLDGAGSASTCDKAKSLSDSGIQDDRQTFIKWCSDKGSSQFIETLDGTNPFCRTDTNKDNPTHNIWHERSGSFNCCVDKNAVPTEPEPDSKPNTEPEPGSQSDTDTESESELKAQDDTLTCPVGKKPIRLLTASYNSFEGSIFDTETGSSGAKVQYSYSKEECEAYTLAALETDVQDVSKTCSGVAVWSDEILPFYSGEEAHPFCEASGDFFIGYLYKAQAKKEGLCCIDDSSEEKPHYKPGSEDEMDELCEQSYGENFSGLFVSEIYGAGSAVACEDSKAASKLAIEAMLKTNINRCAAEAGAKDTYIKEIKSEIPICRTHFNPVLTGLGYYRELHNRFGGFTCCKEKKPVLDPVPTETCDTCGCEGVGAVLKTSWNTGNNSGNNRNYIGFYKPELDNKLSITGIMWDYIHDYKGLPADNAERVVNSFSASISGLLPYISDPDNPPVQTAVFQVDVTPDEDYHFYRLFYGSGAQHVFTPSYTRSIETTSNGSTGISLQFLKDPSKPANYNVFFGGTLQSGWNYERCKVTN